MTEGAGEGVSASEGPIMVIDGCPSVDTALQIAGRIYPRNYRKDMMSFFNPTGYRMTVSPVGFPVAICMAPDLTFGMLGSRYHPDRRFLDCFRGHLDRLPRNMRRNGRFFINEDLLAGADRVFTQVMYLIWIWEIYLATGDRAVLEEHREPLTRCLEYIESRTDEKGIVNQVDTNDWQVSEGADWVDWCPERMEGSTAVYHTWYARALQHCAQIYRVLGDDGRAEMMGRRFARQRRVLDEYFWSGASYYDNIRFRGDRKVNNFWLDSQLWPIAYGFSSSSQSAAIFSRIDAEPRVFEGVPTRWCAPVAQEILEEQSREFASWVSSFEGEQLRPYSWFGRLGAGDILARCAVGQLDHGFRLLERYCEVVVAEKTCPECLDMDGVPRQGTGGQGDYLEHAGGLILATARGIFGIDDTADGVLQWTPRFPARITGMVSRFWHFGHLWQFGFKGGEYWAGSRWRKRIGRLHKGWEIRAIRGCRASGSWQNRLRVIEIGNCPRSKRISTETEEVGYQSNPIPFVPGGFDHSSDMGSSAPRKRDERFVDQMSPQTGARSAPSLARLRPGWPVRTLPDPGGG